MVAVSVPVQGPFGVDHVLTAYVSAWAINRALRDQGMTPGWRIAVLDTENRLIARTLSDDPYDPGIGGEPDRTLLDGLRSGQSHFFATNSKNENLFVSSAVSTMTGWTVTLGMPGDLVELPAKRTLAAVTGGGTLAVAIALSIGWLLARTLMKRQTAERRLLQLELSQAARERTAAILESTTDGVFEMDQDWRIVFINQRARTLIAGGADVSGRILWDVLPEAIGTTFWSHYHRVATERVAAEFEDFYPALNAWFYVRAFPSADGGLAVYFQDVTERRQARDALAESELRYRFLAESVPEIVWTAKPDGTLDYANARLAAYVAKPPADSAQKSGIAQDWNINWKEVVHPEDTRATLNAWRKALGCNTPYECEFRLRRADGMYRWHLGEGPADAGRDGAGREVVRDHDRYPRPDTLPGNIAGGTRRRGPGAARGGTGRSGEKQVPGRRQPRPAAADAVALPVRRRAGAAHKRPRGTERSCCTCGAAWTP